MVTAPLGRAAQDPPAEPPNVLIIVTDDQPVGTLQVMPATRRWFKHQGRSYTQGFVSTPLCCPSRASIMTGRFAHNHGVLTNLDAHAMDQTLTLQAYLQDTGYATAFSGKYLNSWDERTEDPPYFDRFSAISDHTYNRAYNGFTVNEDGTLRSQLDEYSTYYIRDRGIEYLNDFETDDSQPWFMYLAPFAPHHPFHAAPGDEDTRLPGWDPEPQVTEWDRKDKPSWVRSKWLGPAGGARKRALQMRSLLAVDELVDNVMTQLELLGEENTLAFFVSDNGYLWADHRLVGKRWPYTRSIRVPFLARWPGRLEPAIDPRLTQLIDIAPTALEAAGITPTVEMDGRSLLSDASRTRMFMEYAGHTALPRWVSLRTRHYQYVVYHDDTGAVLYREYYNLRRDPYQLRNLLGDGKRSNDPPLDSIRRQLRHARRCAGSACP